MRESNGNLSRSERDMLALIRDRIDSAPGHFLWFDEFMDLCLYAPGLGYYAGDRIRTGREGDFYTSSYVGSVMGEIMARWIAAQAERPCAPGAAVQLAEWGGGTGRLAGQVLDELKTSFPHVYDRISFLSIETNPGHLAQQREQLAAHRDKVAWMGEEEWFGALESGGMWIVWSNELLDAFPVKRLEFRQGEWLEHAVGWNAWRNQPEIRLERCTDAEALDMLAGKAIEWREGQIVELNLRGRAWLDRVLRRLPAGSVLMTIDYGDVDEELFAPHRLQGTLMCYYRHQAHDNPLIHLGDQDMTAHVNFSDLIVAGQSAGVKRWSYMTQRQFLLEHGILDLLEAHPFSDPFHPAARKNRHIRQLLLGDTMGELFKVLIQWKD